VNKTSGTRTVQYGILNNASLPHVKQESFR